MSFGVSLRVRGEYACFTRPEMKVERVSYDIITPSAARGILEAVYWKPSIRWVIDRIHVINPIKFTNIRRNEVGGKLSEASIKKSMRDMKTPVSFFIEEDRQQRAALVLKDVEYIIEAHFEFTSKEDNDPDKHTAMFSERASKGRCFNTPYLGCREFSASFELIEGEIPVSKIQGETDLGWMLHDINYQPADSKNKNSFLTGQGKRVVAEPQFFRAVMKNGIVEVPALSSTGA
ncbi:MAG: type I-C CRISPR-associated protein Cas5c [Deferribacterales bacterium]